MPIPLARARASAEVARKHGVRTAVGGLGIGDRGAPMVEVRRRRAPRFVSPKPVGISSIPMVVVRRPYHERQLVAVIRASAAGGRRDETVILGIFADVRGIETARRRALFARR